MIIKKCNNQQNSLVIYDEFDFNIIFKNNYKEICIIIERIGT